jgi:hypothetical protein
MEEYCVIRFCCGDRRKSRRRKYSSPECGHFEPQEQESIVFDEWYGRTI